ncbi:MAG: LysM peptidoglycan-binding domain-containing protein [Lysobacteraceae bacterium]
MLKKLLSVLAVSLLTIAGFASAVDLRSDHPDVYVVKKGDTLWDISARFLRQPWLWPEIWQANPQIENPHLIYPGDEISLAYLDGQMKLVRRSPEVRREQMDAIPPLPLDQIQQFLRDYRVLDEGDYKGLPYVVGMEENRLRAAAGQLAYVRGLENARPGDNFIIVRPTVRYTRFLMPDGSTKRFDQDEWSLAHGAKDDRAIGAWEDAVHDAKDRRDTLGFEVMRVSTAYLTQTGDPASLVLGANGREVSKGDLVLPAETQTYDTTYYPHAPNGIPADARVLAVSEGILYSGPHQVIALGIGAADGVENGQVYATYRPGDWVEDDVEHPHRIASRRKKNQVQLPDEFNGNAMVFRTFDRVSYALIMDGIKPTRVGDVLKMPADM